MSYFEMIKIFNRKFRVDFFQLITINRNIIKCINTPNELDIHKYKNIQENRFLKRKSAIVF